MLRFFIALIATVSIAAGALAQSFTADAYVEFAKFRTPDGRIIEVGGFYIPVTITPIEATVAKKGNKINKGARGMRTGKRGMTFDFAGSGPTVYTNNNGNSTNFTTLTMASALDDLVLTSEANDRPWDELKMGLHLEGRTTDFQIRWIGYETFTPGLGAGVNAYSDVMFDIGWNIPIGGFGGATVGSFELTFPLATIPLFIVPNQTCFFAQQFREQHAQGEGAFALDISTVFSGTGVTVGSSEDQFYWDFDPAPDGNYDETELDNYGGPPNEANFLLNISVGGNAETSIPSAYNWLRGNEQSGNLGSYWFDDDNFGIAKAGLTLFAGEPPAQLIVESFVSTGDIISMRFDVVSKVNTAGLNMRIELYNYLTDEYDVVHDDNATTSETMVQTLAGVPASRYVSGSSTVKAKISWYQTGLTLLWPWSVSVDQVRWIVVVP